MKSLLACLLLLSACSSDPRLKPGKEEKPAISPSTKFELLPPERTGIDFIPTVQEEFRYNFIADPYIYNGGGVAVIDVNNDGLQDLFFTARLQGCRLYLNKGGLKFEDISEKSGVSKFSGLKTGVTVVDINSDGWQDLYVCRTWLSPLPDRRNLLFVNTPSSDGVVFSEQAGAYGLDDLSASQHANFFDYDLDGDLDCYVLNHPVDFKNMNNLDYTDGPARSQAPKDEFESDRLLKNESGKFFDFTEKAGIKNRAFGLSTIAADFNDDGWPDLFVGNDFVMPDFLYINNGKGAFSDQADSYFRHTSNHTMGADFADLNRDGLADLVTLDMLAAEGPRRQRLMSTMSLERDRQMQQRGFGRQAMRNVLQIADGNGGFSEIGELAKIAATDWSWAPLMADFDNDGWRDLFITSGVKRDLNDLDFFLYTADSINRTGGISKGRFPNFEDYVGLMPSAPSHNYLFQNVGASQSVAHLQGVPQIQGVPHLTNVSEASGFGKPGFSNGAAYADLDNDGDLDLITNNLESPPSIYENKATSFNQHHWLQIKCKGTAQNPFGIGAKVRVWAGGKQVFSQEMTNVRGFYSSVEAIFQIGLGTEKTVDKIEVDWQEQRFQILENVPANQRIVLKIEDAKPGQCPKESLVYKPLFEPVAGSLGFDFKHTENPFEDFDREKLLPYRLSRTGPRISTGDINGDGAEDVFIGGAAGQAGAVFVQESVAHLQGVPHFGRITQPALEADKDCEDTASTFFDADGDGDLDLYVVSGGNEQPNNSPLYQDRLYLNDGKGNLSRAVQAIPTETQSGSCVAVFDFDGDGQKDLFVGGRSVPGRFPEPAESMVLKNEGGVFKNVTATVAPEFQKIGMVTDIQFGDLDGDGKPEMVVVGDWMAVEIFELESQAVTLSHRLTNSSGWWRCLTISDLDGDGDLDLVAGNWGLNSRHHASEAAPLRLFASDFDQNGSLDPLLCTPWEAAYYTVAQRDLLASQIPAVKKKFPRHTPYSNAPAVEIFSEKELLGGICLEAKTLETHWFENVSPPSKGGGGREIKFIAHKLPLEIQTAPVSRILATDFTGDGKTDLLMVGNDYGADAQTYRQDASSGCLLKGDGKGGFNFVPNKVSGFWASEEARDMSLVRLKSGKNVLVLSNNNSQIRAFWAISGQ
ncbi:MAG: VCBS repeat-containing protein [Saprospiraceae bacterium]|nr:VCBS repeat-containing protein [Saprospiraceae bacterium]